MSLAPTATPLYIAPVPSQHPKEISMPSAPFVPEHSTAAHILPETYPAQEFGETSHPSYPSHPVPVQMTKEVIHPFPLPYSDFISSQKEYQMKIVSPSPAPFTKQIENQISHKYLENSVCPTNLPSREQDYNTNIQFQMEQKTEEAKVHKKASVCSQEVSLITATKSTAIEKISESFDTKVVVTSSIQAQERPPSPVPTKQTEEEQYMGAEATSIPNINNPIENVVKEVSSTQAASQEKRQEICLEIKISSNPHEQSKSELPTVNHNNNPKSNPNSDTNPTSNPNPDTKPASNPNPNTNPASNPNTNLASNPNTNPALNPNTNPASNPNTNPGSNPNTNPASNPNPDTNPASNPNPDTNPASNPNPDTNPASNPNPDANPVSNPNPDANPVSNPNPDTDSMSNTNHNTKLVSNPNPNTNLPSNPNPLPNSNNNPNPLTNPNNNPNPLPNPNNNPNPLPNPNNNSNPLTNPNILPNPNTNIISSTNVVTHPNTNINPRTNPNSDTNINVKSDIVGNREEKWQQGAVVNKSQAVYQTEKVYESSLVQTSQSTSMVTQIQHTSLPATDLSAPKGWQSPFVAALTIAPERPYSPFPTSTVPQDLTVSKQSDQQSFESRSPGLSYRQLPMQSNGSFRPISTEYQSTSYQEMSNISTEHSSSIAAPVPFPMQTAPYRPKVEIASSNPMTRSDECPSPMLRALTIAPERPYSPLPGATKAQITTAYQPQAVITQAPSCNQPAVPQQNPPPSKPSMSDGTLLPLLPVASKHMSMLEALTVAPDRPYSPFKPNAIPNTVVQSEASAFTAVSPQAVTTGPRFSSPKATTATPNIFKPLPKSSTLPRAQVSTPVNSSSPRPSSHTSLPVMGGFRPTVPADLSSAGTSQNYQESQAAFSESLSDFQMSQPVEAEVSIVDSNGIIVKRTRRVEENFSHSHKEMQKVIQRSVGQAPIVSSSEFQQHYEQSGQLHQTTVHKQDMKHIQQHQAVKQEHRHTSSFGTELPPAIPFYQKDIERYQVQRALSPAPHSPQVRALSPVPQGQRPATPKQHINKPVTPTFQTKPQKTVSYSPHVEKTPCVSFQSPIPSPAKFYEQQQEQQQQKIYSLSSVQKPSVVPYYQKDIERYQIQRVLSPAPHSQHVRALSPVPQQQRECSPSPQLVSQAQPSHSILKPSSTPQVRQDTNIGQSVQTMQRMQVQSQRRQQASPTGLHTPSSIPFYQQDIERYQMQRAISPAPHSPSVRALSPTPQSVPYQQSGANRGMLPQESQSFPCSFPEDNRTYAAVQSKPQGPNYMLPSKSTQSTSAFKSLPIGPQSPSPFTSQSQFPSNVASQLGAVTKTPVPPTSSSIPNAGVGGVGGIGGGVGGGPSQKGTASIAGSSAPRRGRGILNQQTSGTRIPLCGYCNGQIRGPFITALGKIWCPDHFVCVNGQCRRPLQDIGFVEEKGDLYCEYCFEQFIAPNCDKCSKKVKGDCLNAIGKHFHPECFLCAYCGKMFGNNPFYLEDGLPYCEADWNELFTTKCFACGFPIEAGDRWVEALNNNYHSQCFNCTNCKKNLEGQSFYAKGGRPFCKAHAR